MSFTKISRKRLLCSDSINFPLSQLSCSGIGQAGPLTKVVRKVQREAKDGELSNIKKYVDRLDDEIDKMTRYPWYKQYLEWLTDAISNKVKKMVISEVKNTKSTRFDEEFIHKKEVQNRVKAYYNASLLELYRLRDQYDLDIPQPNKIIFGHTHQPIPWNDRKAPKAIVNNQPLRLFNTGGWLNRNENGEVIFCGAEVFLFESGKGFRSEKV